jgi:hypothetical protein
LGNVAEYAELANGIEEEKWQRQRKGVASGFQVAHFEPEGLMLAKGLHSGTLRAGKFRLRVGFTGRIK